MGCGTLRPPGVQIPQGSGDRHLAYKNLHFCWHGLVSTDVPGAIAYYTTVTSWDTMEIPMGDTSAQMFTAGGIPRAHVMEPPM